MLNPDGVAAGHFRQDSYGNNLNRHYSDPHPETHASIFGAKSVVMHHATRQKGRYIEPGATTRGHYCSPTSPTVALELVIFIYVRRHTTVSWACKNNFVFHRRLGGSHRYGGASGGVKAAVHLGCGKGM